MARNPNRFQLKRKRMQALGDLAPRFRVVIGPQFRRDSKLKLRLPFQRSAVFIVVSGVFLAVFTFPLVNTLGSASGVYDDGLFSLVAVLFSLFWSLGWSVAVIILALLFLMLCFGRETLEIRDGCLRLMVGLPFIGFGADYAVSLIRNLQTQSPDEAAGTGWRGDHLAFDFAGDKIGFGSAIDAAGADEILTAMKSLLPAHANPMPDLKLPALDELDESPQPEQIRPVETVTQEPVPRSNIAITALVLANLIPLAGVVIWDWRVGDIMLLYWAESAVVGFYNLLKIRKVAGWGIVFFGPFFVGHYGGFMVVHLLFIYGFFGDSFSNSTDISVAQLLLDFQDLTPALLGFFISHGISYYSNFLGRQEYVGIDTAAQMGKPYRRIVLMHLTIIFGGFLVMAFSSALPALLLMIVLKVGADMRGHLGEHSS